MPDRQIRVDPSQPKHSQCDPDTAYASQGEATIFTFRLLNPQRWDWNGTAPAVVLQPADQFPAPSYIQPNGRVVVLFDRNTDSNQYTYTLSVIDKNNNNQVVTIDPIIQNQQ